MPGAHFEDVMVRPPEQIQSTEPEIKESTERGSLEVVPIEVASSFHELIRCDCVTILLGSPTYIQYSGTHFLALYSLEFYS